MYVWMLEWRKTPQNKWHPETFFISRKAAREQLQLEASYTVGQYRVVKYTRRKRST